MLFINVPLYKMNWFDIAIFVIIIAAAIKGYISGFIKQLASLAGIIAGAIFAGKIAGFITPYIHDTTQTNNYIVEALSYFIAFLIIVIAFLLLGRIVQGMLEAVKLNFINRLAGVVFSAGKWLIVLSILLNVIVELDQKKIIIKPEIRENSKTYPYIKAITPYFIPFLDFDFQNQE